MIHVKYRDRLGNKLFQYCLGRIIAESIGFELVADPISGFVGTSENVSGQRHQAPEMVLQGHRLDLKKILADVSPRKVVLRGWFQRYQDYYADHERKIKHWLRLPKMKNILGISKDDVIIHIRLGDYYHRYKRALTYDYYDGILSNMSFERMFICTDEPSNMKYLEYFNKYKPTYIGLGEIDTIRLFSLFDKIIMSMSTFSWWGAFLSNASKIYFPICKSTRGAWGKNGKIDLRINSDRYTYIEDQSLLRDQKS